MKDCYNCGRIPSIAEFMKVFDEQIEELKERIEKDRGDISALVTKMGIYQSV